MVLPRLGLWFTNYSLWPPAFLASDFIFNLLTFLFSTGFPGGSEGKESASMQETQVQSLNWEDPLGKGMVTYFIFFAWRIPWTDEPGRLQSMGFQRIEYNWITDFFFFFFTIFSFTFTSFFRATCCNKLVSLLEFYSLNEFASYFSPGFSILGLAKSVSTICFSELSWWLSGKECTCNEGDVGSDPWVRKIP